jgi:bacterioferritin-associated ferredoxin
VTDSDIRNAVNDGVRNLKQLRQITSCGATCGSCKEMAGEILEQALADERNTRNLIPVMQLG